MDFPECDQFRDHRRTICRGERSDLSRETMSKYRVMWGLSPLADDLPRPEATTVAASTPTTASPSLAQRVVEFAAALQEHLRDGLAKCDSEQIEVRLQICRDCPSFTGTHCRECGCPCNSRHKFLNKLAWRSERCPLGRW